MIKNQKGLKNNCHKERVGKSTVDREHVKGSGFLFLFAIYYHDLGGLKIYLEFR